MTMPQPQSDRVPGIDAKVAIPPSLSPDIQAAGVRLLTRAEAMGLLAPGEFSPATLEEALTAFSRAGIARAAVSQRDVDNDPRGALDLVNDMVEVSPHPATEWSAMADLFGTEGVARLTGVSLSSVRRYLTGERHTPDDVATRLHWLAMRVADLSGSYNDYGVRRWFQRSRTALGGDAPEERLTGSWSPSDPAVTEIAELAEGVLAIEAT